MDMNPSPEQFQSSRRQMAELVAVGQVAPFLADMAAVVARLRDEQGPHAVDDFTTGWAAPDSWPKWKRVVVGVVEALTSGFLNASLAVVEALPPNWPPAVTLHDLSTLEHMMIQEGLPAAWVPRSVLLRRLVDAPDARGRAELLVASTQDVADDCNQSLDLCVGAGADGQVRLARGAAAALKDGHRDAAQALAAAVLDTAVTALMVRAARNERDNRCAKGAWQH